MMPPDQASADEPDAEGATTAGNGRAVNTDGILTFPLPLTVGGRHAQFLAVADGSAFFGLGDLATATALDAFEESIRQSRDRLRTDRGNWQNPVAQVLVEAYARVNRRVQAVVGEQVSAPPISLASAALLGHWLCVANVGGGRIYRLSQGILESVAPTFPTRGDAFDAELRGYQGDAPDGETPYIEFHQLRPGDVVLVCSDGLGQALEDGVISSLLYSVDSPDQIARSLIFAGQARGGRDDMSAVVAKLADPARTSLPDFLNHLIAAPESAEKPRVRFGRPDDWSWRTALFTLAACAVLVLAGILSFRPLWLARRTPALEPVGSTVLPQAPAPATAATPPPAPATSTATLAATTPDSTLTQPAPASPAPTSTPARSAEPSTKSTAPRARPSAPVQVTRTVVPVVPESTPEQIRQATIERIRDSIIVAENARAAKAASDSAARLAADSAVRVADLERAAQDSTARAANVAAEERARRDRVASGTKALTDWVTGMAAAATAGQADSPLLTVAPPSFVAFVRKSRPTLKAIKLGEPRVDQQIAETNVQWVAEWKSAFGTTKTKSMKGTISMIYYNGSWSPRTWYMSEGAP